MVSDEQCSGFRWPAPPNLELWDVAAGADVLNPVRSYEPCCFWWPLATKGPDHKTPIRVVFGGLLQRRDSITKHQFVLFLVAGSAGSCSFNRGAPPHRASFEGEAAVHGRRLLLQAHTGTHADGRRAAGDVLEFELTELAKPVERPCLCCNTQARMQMAGVAPATPAAAQPPGANAAPAPPEEAPVQPGGGGGGGGGNNVGAFIGIAVVIVVAALVLGFFVRPRFCTCLCCFDLVASFCVSDACAVFLRASPPPLPPRAADNERI